MIKFSTVLSVRWQKTALWLLLKGWLVCGAKANVPFAGRLFTLTDNGKSICEGRAKLNG